MTKIKFKTTILSDIAEVIDSRHKTPRYSDDGYPMVRVVDVKGGCLGLKQTKRVSKDVYDDFSKGRSPKIGDLVISRVGSYGNVSYVNSKDLFCLGQNTALIVPKIDWKFLYYQMISPLVQNQIKDFAVGAVQKTVSLKNIRNLKIDLPSLTQQKKIAKILGDLDAKIENNIKMNETLEKMAQAIFKEWFINFKFPGHEKTKFIDGLPEGWKEVELGSVAELVAGGDKPKEFSAVKTDEFKVPIYSNGIKDKGLYGFTNNARISEESVTVSARGTIGYVALRTSPYVPIVRLISVIPDTSLLSSKYLYFMLKSMRISGSGTTQQQLTIPEFRSTKVVVPTIDLVKDFTLVVNSLWKNISHNQNEVINVEKMRNTLLPKLLNGEIEV